MKRLGRAGARRHRSAAAPFARPRSAAAQGLLEKRHVKTRWGGRGEEKRGVDSACRRRRFYVKIRTAGAAVRGDGAAAAAEALRSCLCQ